MSESHIWSDKGTYTIIIQAEDFYGGLSNETCLKFIIGKSKSSIEPIFQ